MGLLSLAAGLAFVTAALSRHLLANSMTPAA
jgi:hypothetical protein